MPEAPNNPASNSGCDICRLRKRIPYLTEVLSNSHSVAGNPGHSKFTRSSFLCERFYSRHQCSHCQLALLRHRAQVPQVQLRRARQHQAPPREVPRAQPGQTQLEQTPAKQELHQPQGQVQAPGPVPWVRCKRPSPEAPPLAARRRLRGHQPREHQGLRAARDR
jgi:hypothetical protein